MKKYCALFFAIWVLVSRGEDVKPKPKGQLRLEYNSAKYEMFVSDCPFTFDKNTVVRIKQNADCGLELHYPKMKATVYLTYKKVNGDLEKLLIDAQKLTYEHVIKANDIAEQPYVNLRHKVFGMFYQVGGNAATNAQFYATDSTRNFLVGSMYFYAKPNFDSILPAADYIKNDMKHIIESLKWK
jgi:gliding motility-associated lipoprotein GldD